jgi:hypothetical protein
MLITDAFRKSRRRRLDIDAVPHQRSAKLSLFAGLRYHIKAATKVIVANVRTTGAISQAGTKLVRRR